jgi:hypothetical protein
MHSLRHDNYREVGQCPGILIGAQRRHTGTLGRFTGLMLKPLLDECIALLSSIDVSSSFDGELSCLQVRESDLEHPDPCLGMWAIRPEGWTSWVHHVPKRRYARVF